MCDSYYRYCGKPNTLSDESMLLLPSKNMLLEAVPVVDDIVVAVTVVEPPSKDTPPSEIAVVVPTTVWSNCANHLDTVGSLSRRCCMNVLSRNELGKHVFKASRARG